MLAFVNRTVFSNAVVVTLSSVAAT